MFVGGEELPAIDKAAPILSFFAVADNVRAFVAQFSSRKLEAAQIASIMGVSRFGEFEGTREDAQAMVDKYLEGITVSDEAI